MQTHLAPRTLQGKKPESDTQALFAVKPNRKAIVFIHGFSGQSIKTWSNFHELLPGCPRCEPYDMFFYGYDGLWAELNANASIFRGFLQHLFEHSDQMLAANLPPSAQRAADFKYDEIVIVAHSLGAVIARRALLDATRDAMAWPSATKLVLYAPAHKGANVLKLAFESLGRWKVVQAFGAGIQFASPLIDQLRPDSQDLADLLNDTLAATANGANRHLIASKVILATRERIVRNTRFATDPTADAIPDTTHTSVCKPTDTFRQPLILLESVL